MQCPVCHGHGGVTEPVLDDGTGPWYDCEFCEGTGDMKGHKFYRVLAMLSVDRRRHVKDSHDSN